MKIVTILGARPQFVKAGVVSRALQKLPDVQELIVHTGQHYDDSMSKIFFDELEIPRPAYNLEIGSGSHGEQTGRMLAAIEKVLVDERPQWTLVYGDTNSTLAGALAAAKLHIPIAHVEAGLRSFNRRMAEEVNRLVTDHLSDLLCAPTSTAVGHLLREGIPESKVTNTGDVMYDAALFYGARAKEKSTVLHQLNLDAGTYLLATVHRAENTDDRSRLEVIYNSLLRVAEEMSVVFPVHPRTRRLLADSRFRKSDRLRLIDPVGYMDMVALEANAKVIATDSGGVQKEAYFHRVPSVTLRDETEWPELLEMGWNQLVPPTDVDRVTTELLAARVPASQQNNVFPFGRGDSAEAVAKLLVRGRVS